MLGAAALVIRWAYGSSDATFNRIVGWVTITSLFVAVIGVLVSAHSALRNRLSDVTANAIAEAEDFIAAAVLAAEGEQLRILLGTDRPGLRRINLRFRRVLTPYQTAGGTPTGDLEGVRDFYQSLTPGRLVVLGEPGSGKTVLATYLLIRLLEMRAAGPGQAGPVPVRYGLGDYDPLRSLDDWLCQQLVHRFPSLNRSTVSALVRRRRVLPVLDGLDEMDLGAGSRAALAIERINSYFYGSAAGPIVVTCRTTAYGRAGGVIDDATSVEIESLTANEIATFLTGHMRGREDETAWFDVITPLRSDPTGSVATELVTELSTPWVLTLAVAAYHGGNDPAQLLARQATGNGPGVKELLLGQFVRSAVLLHNDSGPVHYKHRKVIAWLGTVATFLRQQEAHGGSGTDLTLHLCWPVAGTTRPRAVHALLAAAGVVVGFVAIALSIPDPRAFSTTQLLRYADAFPHLEKTFVGATLVVLFGLVILPLLAARAVLSDQPRPSRLDWSQLGTGRGRRQLATGATVGVLVGAGVGLTMGLTSGLAIRPSLGLFVGSISGLFAGVAFGLAFGADRGDTRQIGPRDALHGDLVHGLAYGSMIGLAGVIIGCFAVSVSYGAAVGAATGLIHGLLIGPVAALRYRIAVVLCAQQGLLPLRFGDFLDWTVAAGLLKTSGTAYQFRHRELQIWLERDASESEGCFASR
jgi:hypothetical protein